MEYLNSDTILACQNSVASKDVIVSPQILIALGVVTAALIAGFFSFLNLIISKEQKISEFRQQWIDSLRDDIAQYVSGLNYLSALSKNRSKNDEGLSNHEFWKSMEAHQDNTSRAYTSIFLRINSSDKNIESRLLNVRFLNQLQKTNETYLDSQYEETDKCVDELRELVKPLLKVEWERVKKGERAYRWSRNTAAIILVAGLAFSVYGFLANS